MEYVNYVMQQTSKVRKKYLNMQLDVKVGVFFCNYALFYGCCPHRYQSQGCRVMNKLYKTILQTWLWRTRCDLEN